MARDSSEMFEVKGLKELQKELRRASPEMGKRLQMVNKQLAERVAERARGRVYSSVPGAVRQGPARPSGRGSLSRTRASIRARAGQTSASVVGGGPKAPGFYGHEFGGGARPRTRQFPQHRGKQGYFLYPTVREEVRDVFDEWNDLFDEVMGTREGPL